MSRKPLLTIESLHAERDVISIENKVYELRSPSEFGLRDQRRITQLGKSIGIMSQMDQASDDELADAEFALEELLKMIFVDMPYSVFERLATVHRIGIATTFFTQLNNTMSGRTPTEEETVEAEIDNLIGAR